MPDAPPSPAASPWWTPAVHADRRPILIGRNRIEAALRGYLAAEDFVMVDPPGLQRSPGNETHLHAFATTLIGEDGAAATRYLHTSPEFSMKSCWRRERRIASLGHVAQSRAQRPPPSRVHHARMVWRAPMRR